MKTLPKKNVVFALLVLFLFLSIPISESAEPGPCWTLKSLDESHRGTIPQKIVEGIYTTIITKESTANYGGGKLVHTTKKFITTNRESRDLVTFQLELKFWKILKNKSIESSLIPERVCYGDEINVTAVGKVWGDWGRGHIRWSRALFGPKNIRGFGVRYKPADSLGVGSLEAPLGSGRENTVRIEYDLIADPFNYPNIQFGFTMNGVWVIWTYQLEK